MKREITTSFVIILITLLLITALSAGCQAKIKGPQPPEINYGRDLCDRCGMIISEERFASGLQLKEAKYLKFDDTGEMLKYISSHPETDILAWWVHDYDSLEWIRGEEAFFVKSATLQTPMGTGILTFQSKDRAEQFASENNGSVYSLEEIQSQVSMPMNNQ